MVTKQGSTVPNLLERYAINGTTLQNQAKAKFGMQNDETKESQAGLAQVNLF